MAMMLGTSGSDLVRNLAAQATGKGIPRGAFWGNVIGRNVPQAFVGQIADRMKRAFIQRFARNTASGAIGRMMPFGIGAVIGGTGSHLLGKKVVNSSREAFGPAPAEFPLNLEPRVRQPREPRSIRTRMQALPAVPGMLAGPVRAGLSRLRPSRHPIDSADDRQRDPEASD
jgi:hypothetical protein